MVKRLLCKTRTLYLMIERSFFISTVHDSELLAQSSAAQCRYNAAWWLRNCAEGAAAPMLCQSRLRCRFPLRTTCGSCGYWYPRTPDSRRQCEAASALPALWWEAQGRSGGCRFADSYHFGVAILKDDFQRFKSTIQVHSVFSERQKRGTEISDSSFASSSVTGRF